jgi:hypothetical protein
MSELVFRMGTGLFPSWIELQDAATDITGFQPGHGPIFLLVSTSPFAVTTYRTARSINK